MKKFIIIAMLTAIMPLAAMAQHEEDTENGVVSLAGREGFTIETKKGDFVFKPYLLVQTSANFNWYDDEGLDKAYNQDNIANSGFSVPYAVLGFTGKAFDKISFNLSINAAASGGALLQQAWFDVQLKKQFAIRVGKFKTPFSHAYLTTLGETLLPNLPVSLTAPVILPYSLNAVTPNIGTGFDLGVEIHGLVADKFGYEIGLFNGTGASVNTATKTFSDDWHIPSLLYAGRFTYMPKGVSIWKPRPEYQGWIDTLHGGIQAVLMDEICAWVVLRKLQTTGVTSKMETRYRKSVDTKDSHIVLRASIKEVKRNIVIVEAKLYNEDGEVCTESVCTYFTFSKEKSKDEMHFTKCDVEPEEILPLI